MTRPTAGDRMRRILAIVPWLAAHPGVRVDEVCARFDLTRAALLADLEVLPFIGVPPYTPDTLIQVGIDDDRIEVVLAQPFDRPLRLTPEQALALVAAGRAARDLPGADPGDPLQRGLAKLAGALGVDPDEVVEVHLGPASTATLSVLRAAAADRRRLEIDYYSYGRDERTTRQVDPHRVVAEHGRWYLEGHCHRSGGQRLFRVDRIVDVRPLDLTFAPPGPDPDADLEAYRPAGDDPRVTLVLPPTARWVIEQYPHEGAEERPDGGWTVRLPVSADAWLARLLLRLGPDAAVVAADDPRHLTLAAASARRVRARYA
ncbi:MAG TPA: WYL domain-containing protein [Acidimicrobiales bacterium]|nr:WYL domain-containing protein [Acidimicrobiales bacterium]